MIHVVTPFSRTHLIQVLVEDYRKLGVQWHPLCHTMKHVEMFPKESWIHPTLIELPEGCFDQCYYKLNKWLETAPDEGYVMFTCDDDRILELPIPESEVTFLTINRGYKAVGHPYCHSAGKTEARPGANIGSLEAGIVRLSLAKTLRFRMDTHHADTAWNKVLLNYEVDYKPQYEVQFNYYQPGRWYPDVLVQFPVKGRKEQFLKCFQKWWNWRVRFNIVINESDEILNTPEFINQFPTNVQVSVFKGSGKVAACNHIPSGPFDILILASDDVTPLVEDYDLKIIEAMKSRRDCLLNLPDGKRDMYLRWATIPVIGYDYYKKYSYVYYPEYKSLACDGELRDVANRDGKLIVIHDIWFEQINNKDEQAQTEANLHKMNDARLLEIRRALGYPTATPKALSYEKAPATARTLANGDLVFIRGPIPRHLEGYAIQGNIAHKLFQ